MSERDGFERGGPLDFRRPESCLRGEALGRLDARGENHYDHPPEFYRLFLDESLTYSCAYFKEGTETLEQAQRAKHELVCRKLALRGGDRVLDVGCGSGGFLLHAARAHGAIGVHSLDYRSAHTPGWRSATRFSPRQRRCSP